VTAVITCRTTKENPQSESTKNFDNLRRLGKLDVGFLHENFQRLFFAPKKFPSILRFNFPFSFRNQNP
jgi:hypothetical protein